MLETRLPCGICPPLLGFRGFYNSSTGTGYAHGGIAVFVKNWLVPFVTLMDMSVRDQIVFGFGGLTPIKFIGAYIPPAGSRYFEPEHLLSLERALNRGAGDRVLCMGDLNAKMGNFSDLLPGGCRFSYAPNVDASVNTHGRTLKSVCYRKGLVVLNHLRLGNGQEMDGGFTFVQGSAKSQIDLAICSPQIASSCTFRVLRDKHLPSDHLPVSVTLRLRCCVDLRQISAECNDLVSRAGLTSRVKRPKFSECDIDSLRGSLVTEAELCLYRFGLQPSIANFVDDVTAMFSDSNVTRHRTGRAIGGNQTQEVSFRSPEHFATALLRSDPKRFWNAIDWKGRLRNSKDGAAGTVRDYTAAFSCLLSGPEERPKPAASSDPPDVLLPYVPILDDPIEPGEVITALKKLNPNKSPGLDGVQGWVVKNIPDRCILLLSVLFSAILESAVYPANWNCSMLVPLPKKEPYRRSAAAE